MKLYSERFKNVELCNIPTYDEILTVRNGFTETELPNSIRAIQSTQWGFIRVAEEPSIKESVVEEVEVKTEEPVIEKVEVKIEEPVVEKTEVKTEEPAMTVSDVDAILGSKKTTKVKKRPMKRR